MKARVKATGEIVEITSGVICIDKNGYKQTIHSDFIEPYVDISTDNDYWEKLKHQYAGMAMQGMFANPAYKDVHIKLFVLGAVGAATKLIEELKEKEK